MYWWRRICFLVLVGKVNSPRRVVSSPRKHPQSPRGAKRASLAPTSLASFFKMGRPSANKEVAMSNKTTQSTGEKQCLVKHVDCCYAYFSLYRPLDTGTAEMAFLQYQTTVSEQHLYINGFFSYELQSCRKLFFFTTKTLVKQCCD